MCAFLFGWRLEKTGRAGGAELVSRQTTGELVDRNQVSLDSLLEEHRAASTNVNSLRQSGTDAEWLRAFAQQSQLLAQILEIDLRDNAKIQQRDKYLDDFCRSIGLRDRTELRKYRAAQVNKLPH